MRIVGRSQKNDADNHEIRQVQELSENPFGGGEGVPVHIYLKIYISILIILIINLNYYKLLLSSTNNKCNCCDENNTVHSI
jgi:hypothetical protein